MNRPDHIEIRPLETKDHQSLMDHLNPWNYQKKGIAFFEWLASFRSSENISMVAIDNNRVVGYYGTIPIPLKVGDRVLTAYRGGFFVHPDHRKKYYNLLNLLVRRVHEEAKKRNAAIYIFPLGKLRKYLQRRIHMIPLKYISHYVYLPRTSSRTLVVLRRLFQTLCHRMLTRKKSSFEEFTIRDIHHFDERFDDLWDRATQKKAILSSRRSDYLNCRYLEAVGEQNIIFAAEKCGKILGYVILRPPDSSPEKRGLIIDLFDIEEPAVTNLLLDKAVTYFEKNGSRRIELYLSGRYYEKILHSVGFTKLPPHPTGAKLAFAKHYSDEISDDIFYDPDNWFLTTTDTLFA